MKLAHGKDNAQVAARHERSCSLALPSLAEPTHLVLRPRFSLSFSFSLNLKSKRTWNGNARVAARHGRSCSLALLGLAEPTQFDSCPPPFFSFFFFLFPQSEKQEQLKRGRTGGCEAWAQLQPGAVPAG